MSFDLALINNDLVLQVNGDVRTVTDTPKLRQDILKIILTPLGSIKSHMWYGCSIGEDVIGLGTSDLMYISRIQISISKGLDRLKALQQSQSVNQNVSLAELIDIVAAVDVQRDVSDPRQINVVVTVLSKRLTKIEEIFTIMS